MMGIHVADELADGRERGVTDPLEVGDDGGQPRPGQAAALDRERERGVIASCDSGGTKSDDCGARGSPGARRGCRPAGRRWVVRRRSRAVPSAAGAGIQQVVGGVEASISGGNSSRWVCGVSRLPAGPASLLAGRRWRLGRLDDVRGGRLGRVRGILAGRGELFLQLLDRGLEGIEPCLQVIELLLQPLAIGTRSHCIGFHGGRVYTTCAGDSTL